jgi:hypothetical protein
MKSPGVTTGDGSFKCVSGDRATRVDAARATIRAFMHAMLAVLLFAATRIAAVSAPAICPTAPQIDAALQRLGEGGTVDRLGESEVTVVGGTMRIVLRDRAGAMLGVREVPAPAECAKRVSVAAVLLAAWAKTWGETALAPAERAEVPRPRRTHQVELGIGLGGSVDGDARAPSGGLLAGVDLYRGLGAAMAADVAGQRQVALGQWAATYLVSRLGVGLALRVEPGFVWADVALLPQITRLSIEGKNVMTPHTAAVWGASVEGRGRIGLRWRGVAPFVSIAVNRALVRQTLTLDDRPDSARLSAWDVGVVLGVSWILGGHG